MAELIITCFRKLPSNKTNGGTYFFPRKFIIYMVRPVLMLHEAASVAGKHLGLTSYIWMFFYGILFLYTAIHAPSTSS